MIGKITKIETMGSADGPGVRLVLFMAGCKLRCIYCHNPETWCLSGKEQNITPEEVLKIYKKYNIYYGDKGGVTFSGGEPLLQTEFVLETIKLLKQNNIHTAIDTSGVADNYDEILKLVDLVILDVKSIDENEYKHITGHNMDNFNMFVDKCKSLNKKLWLRQVIVPNLNDDEEHILRLKQFTSTLNNVERIELLPYHTMGVYKYNELGLEYELAGVQDMDKERCKQLEILLK